MKNRKIHFLLVLLALLTACQRKPRFIHHPPPDLSVIFEPFNGLGCPPTNIELSPEFAG